MAEKGINTKSCTHYSRTCSLFAPCCNKVYPCRLCHDDKEDHVIDRFAIKQIVCRKCVKIQPVSESCTECSIKFARYFCSVCNLFDDAERGQFHCNKCGICRIGGRDKFIHCDTCGLCLHVSVTDSHKCVQQASRSNCPVCMEDIHTSRNAAHVPDCGHLLHKKCFTEMLENGLYQCPQCQTSMVDMSSHWDSLDSERQRWLLPPQFRDFQVKIMCRDCREESETVFHFIGLKCTLCGSYNTVRNGSETLPLEDVNPAMLPLDNDNNSEESGENDMLYLMDMLLSPNLRLQPTPSTDSDEFETPSTPGLTDDELEYDYDDEDEDNLLGGIPLLPPWLPQHWLPQHSDDPDMQFLTNQLPLHLNINGENSDYDLSDHEHNWDSANISPFVQLANSLLPAALDTDSGGLNVPHVWELDVDTSNERTGDNNNKDDCSSDGWETVSEEEVIGGDEEDLGKEKCQVFKDQGENNHLGDVAPAN